MRERKEADCTQCVHREICSIKEELLTVKNELDILSYGTYDGGVMRLAYSKAFYVELHCRQLILD